MVDSKESGYKILYGSDSLKRLLIESERECSQGSRMKHSLDTKCTTIR
jgi:hypothetical protein